MFNAIDLLLLLTNNFVAEDIRLNVVLVFWALWLGKRFIEFACRRRRRNSEAQTNPRITRNGWGVIYINPNDPNLPYP